MKRPNQGMANFLVKGDCVDMTKHVAYRLGAGRSLQEDQCIQSALKRKWPIADALPNSRCH